MLLVICDLFVNMPRNERIRMIRQNRADVRRRRLYRIGAVFMLLFAMIPLSYIIMYYHDIHESNNILSGIHKLLDTDKLNGQDEQQAIADQLAKLRGQNSDSRFILQFSKLGINNVVVQGPDNDYYVHRNFMKNYSLAGWLFMDYRNKPNDRNHIIYGHNMRDGKTMFSPLSKLTDKRFWDSLSDDDKTISIKRPDRIERYRIFAVYTAHDSDADIRVVRSNQDMRDYISSINSRSLYKPPNSSSDYDHIITLLTCGRDNDHRNIIHAYKLPD